ncbi:MAG: FliI/YscN family ATPase [Planctomycetes bacterium]|nr:FliI/YscN family ATPase [Planctomycetota bacterium]
MSLFSSYAQIVRHVRPMRITGSVAGVRGLTVSVADFGVPIGSACRICRGGQPAEARVIGFAADHTLVMPMGSTAGIRRGDRVVCTSGEQTLGVGRSMLGRVLNALGKPIDGRGPLTLESRRAIYPDAIDPMRRERISEPIGTGIRAIDSMLTIGRGQRMGIFAGPGVGKSVLLGMVGRYTSADVTVIALVGERGREVRDFIEKDLGEEGMKKAVLVVATGDEPPLVRVQAGAVATAVAEYFRDAGCDVLLLMDSLTRLAMAQRQIGLVAGEPPATKGYTPSVFNLLPELLERSGRTARGSITGFYTVLVEGDDMTDPIADAVRSITDGHVWLSRSLANRGQYPAIDVLESVSRVMIDVTDQTHREAARDVQRVMAVYRDIEDLVNIGAYARGTSAECDQAVDMLPAVREFLRQDITDRCSYAQAKMGLVELARKIRQHKPAGPAMRGRTVA